MNFSDINTEDHRNLLLKDGAAYYFGNVFSSEKAFRYFEILQKNILWRNSEAILFGKKIISKRKVAWYGEAEFEYTYSKITQKALLWTPELLEIKKTIETVSGQTYNSCLLNLYHTGAEGMGWHSDAEKELEKDRAIASVSFGAARRFEFRHKESGETVSILLENGSLLLMNGPTQTYWQHRLPTTKKINEPRINLTFRTIAIKKNISKI